jgi:hypothetical protein
MVLLPALLAAGAALCGTTPGTARDAFLLHEAQARVAASSQPAADFDAGQLAVLVDQGELVIRRNLFDLDAAGVRFTPTADGGFEAAPMALPLEAEGDALPVRDDSPVEVALPFAFPYFGALRPSVVVHADGFLRFGTLATEPAERGPGRVLQGPPSIAAFLAPLDPARGGRVSARLLADRAVFAWSEVPGAGQSNRNTFAVTLRPDGSVDVVFGRLETREGVVGVSPGDGGRLAPVDLSAGGRSGTDQALVESFAERERLDVVAAVRRFLASHDDAFEQIVVYTTRPLNPQPGSLAFAVDVRNDVSGIGLPVHDDSAAWGSAGRLASVVYMDTIDAFADADAFEILGHETGHRWLARLRFRGTDGVASGALLGRGDVHWSFFHDTRASVLEGNRIEPADAGRFATTDIVRAFSPLDQYAMGLRAAAEVPPFFHVAEADDFRPARTYKASSGPEVGVSFSGDARAVTIADVVAVHGPRVPDASVAPRRLAQAYLLVSDAAETATSERIAILERIRSRFPAWYLGATESRGSVSTTLR